MTAISQLREAWSEAVSGARRARISALRPSSIGLGGDEDEVRHEGVAGVERQVQDLRRLGAGQQLDRGEGALGLGGGELELDGARVDALAEPGVPRIAFRPPLDAVSLGRERPDLVMRWEASTR